MRKLKRIKFKRRLEGKTDYKLRFGLLKSNIPRLVVRKTNKKIIVQIVKSKEAKDKVICYANPKILIKKGWKFSLKTLPAAYLLGKIIAKKAKEKKIEKVILDIGLIDSIKGSRIYAVVKGAIDSGLKVKCDEKMFPDEERIKGKHLKNPEVVNAFEKIKNELK